MQQFHGNFLDLGENGTVYSFRDQLIESLYGLILLSGHAHASRPPRHRLLNWWAGSIDQSGDRELEVGSGDCGLGYESSSYRTCSSPAHFLSKLN